MGKMVKRVNGDDGGLGELRTCSSSMLLMQRMVKVANGIADKEIAKMVKLATTVRDNTDCSARDRMRAVELLNAMIAKGIDVAQYIDKTERLDSGKPTENVGVKFLKVEFDE